MPCLGLHRRVQGATDALSSEAGVDVQQGEFPVTVDVGDEVGESQGDGICFGTEDRRRLDRSGEALRSERGCPPFDLRLAEGAAGGGIDGSGLDWPLENANGAGSLLRPLTN